MQDFEIIFFTKDDGTKPAKVFIKKTQETPPSEIDRAKKYRNEHLNREENMK